MKEQTPLERLIEKLKLGTQKAYGEQVLSFEYFLKVAESLLPEERKEIIEAYNSEMHDENCGCGKCDYCIEFTSDPPITGEQYYQTKFKQ